MSRFPLVIIAFIFAEAIFGLLKTVYLFPVGKGHTNLIMMTSCNAAEVFFMLSAIWIFALKYHETASELSIMLGSEMTTLFKGDTFSE